MSGPLYPNQQLRAVSVETYFPGQLGALSRMGSIQKEFRDAFPNLYVPNNQPGEPIALRPYQLRDAGPSRSLALAVNQATFVAFDYPGYSAFSAEAQDVLARSLALLEVDELSRVVYAYDNAIEMPVHAEGTIALHLLVDLHRTPAWLGSQRFQQLDLEWRRKVDGGYVHGKLFQEPAPSGACLRLQLRGVAEPAGSTLKLGESIALAHDKSVEIFDSMITERFKAFLQLDPATAPAGSQDA